MINVGLLGCGRLGRIVAKGLHEGAVDNCRLVGVCGRTMERSQAIAEACGCTACRDVQQLLSLSPQYIIDASTEDALAEHAVEILSAGCHLICLSSSAFQDPVFSDAVRQAALKHGTQVHLVPGAIGGFDFLTAARLMGPVQVSLTQRKYPPESDKCPPGFKRLPAVYRANAKEAVANYPERLNIAAALGVACQDWEGVEVRLEPIPDDEAMSFQVDLQGKFGAARFYMQQGTPECPVNGPDIAAWSTLAALQRLTAPITF